MMNARKSSVLMSVRVSLLSAKTATLLLHRFMLPMFYGTCVRCSSNSRDQKYPEHILLATHRNSKRRGRLARSRPTSAIILRTNGSAPPEADAFELLRDVSPTVTSAPRPDCRGTRATNRYPGTSEHGGEFPGPVAVRDYLPPHTST